MPEPSFIPLHHELGNWVLDFKLPGATVGAFRFRMPREYSFTGGPISAHVYQIRAGWTVLACIRDGDVLYWEEKMNATNLMYYSLVAS